MSVPKVTNAFFNLWKQDNRRKYDNKTTFLTMT
jgi:hypothetical protein